MTKVIEDVVDSGPVRQEALTDQPNDVVVDRVRGLFTELGEDSGDDLPTRYAAALLGLEVAVATGRPYTAEHASCPRRTSAGSRRSSRPSSPEHRNRHRRI